MMTDNALANFCISSEMREGGDTDKRGAEHRSFTVVVHSQLCNKTGYFVSLFNLENISPRIRNICFVSNNPS